MIHTLALSSGSSRALLRHLMMGTRHAIAGVAAQRTVTTSIVKAPALLTCIVYNFPSLTEDVSQRAAGQ